MKVSEIFTSIQGESSLIGIPMIFIRLSGCNLRCSYCDTTYAFENGKNYTIEEILKLIKKYKLKYIEITGGEPLLQEEVHDLIDELVKNYNVVLETNGSVPIDKVNPNVKIIMDIKTPGSGMSNYNCLQNLRFLKETDEIKFVITDRNDYEWSKQFIQEYPTKVREILFSPAFGLLDAKELAQWLIEDSLNVRLNVQIHKYILVR